jgi:carboxyl-terminal processing protease
MGCVAHTLAIATTVTILLASCVGVDQHLDADVSSCATSEADIAALCEATDVIERHYVDSIDPAQLTAAGRAAIGALPPGNRAANLACPTDEVVGPICQDIRADSIDPTTGAEAAMRGIAAKVLDPHSGYLDAVGLRVLRENASGRVEGIGALVQTRSVPAADGRGVDCPIVSDDCHLVVVATSPGGPADAGGLARGDVIITIDGRGTDGMTTDDVTKLVRGDPRTTVLLGVVRNGAPMKLAVTREAVDLPVSSSALVGDTGYIKLTIFTENAFPRFRTQVERLVSDGAHRLVLDLRDNPGGSLETAVQVVGVFLDSGSVVTVRTGEAETSYPVPGSEPPVDLPLFVLINAASASASEVAAGVLAERHRATTVGQRSYGKDTVQQLFPLVNGGAMKLTVARWLTPLGNDVGGTGLEPDIGIDLAPELTAEDVVAAVLAATERYSTPSPVGQLTPVPPRPQ